MRPPRARVASIAATVAAPTSNHSLCMRCSLMRSTRTGWKVPAPTCRVIAAVCTPRAAKRGQQRLVEVQRRGGCRHRAGARGEHGLVAGRVIVGVGVFDVGRQRHMAVLFEQLQRVGREAQMKQRIVGPRAAQHFGIEGLRKTNSAAGPWRFARPHMRPDLVAVEHPLDQRFDRTTGGLFAQQARLDDARVVEDQQIAGQQQVGQLAKDAIGGQGAGAVEQP